MRHIYSQRRQALIETMEGPCAVCVFSGCAPMKSLDAAYPFEVDRNFFYLTGIQRENMILLIKKNHNGQYSEALYIEPYDEVLAKWVGARMRNAEATEISGVEQIFSVEDFDSHLNSLVERGRGLGKLRVWLDLWRHHKDQADTPAHCLAAKLQKQYPAVEINDFFGHIAAMRACKGEEELAFMRQAQEDTRAAIESMMQHSYAGVNESELEGIFDFALMKRNVRQHAFPSIVAGGARATTLHYVQNDQQVNDGELVLIDLGSACGNYCADISRTFPVNGKFTQRQRELYNTVLNAQQIVIDNCKPGKTLAELNQLVIDYYESRLDDLGLRKDGKTVRDYYYHSVSHQLGLDTHDICTERERTLRPGMVITVEPGLYVEEEAIGIRIENDVCITEDGCEDLSHNIPKTVEEIEALMAK